MVKIKEKIKKLRQMPLHDAIKFLDSRCGLAFLERMFFVHWFNPIATFYINLRCFPLRQALKFPFWAYGRPTIYSLAGNMRIDGCKCKTGLIRFNRTMVGAPNFQSVQSELNVNGTIIFQGNTLIGCGTKISVSGVLTIGGDTKITDFVNVGCRCRIDIGERCRIVHKCQLLDSNYHYVANMQKGIVAPSRKPIKIGEGCWICNTSTITGGSVIPNFCIVASNSLVGKDFSEAPQGSFICGIPAKIVPAKMVRINNIKWEKDINNWYSVHDISELFMLPDGITMDELSHLDCNNL